MEGCLENKRNRPNLKNRQDLSIEATLPKYCRF